MWKCGGCENVKIRVLAKLAVMGNCHATNDTGSITFFASPLRLDYNRRGAETQSKLKMTPYSHFHINNLSLPLLKIKTPNESPG